MGCGCRNSHPDDSIGLNKNPDTPCIFCAHKHISAARQLYDLEPGYRDINKSNAIGQLILAAWHYDKEHHNLALRCRDLWLRIERQEEVGDALAALQETAWDMVVKASEKKGRSE